MRRRLIQWLHERLGAWLRRPVQPDYKSENRMLESRLNALAIENNALVRQRMSAAAEFMSELLEARQMAGSGPWRVAPSTLAQTDGLIRVAAEAARRGVGLKEALLALREDITQPPISVGAYSDIELALQNVEWRREINLSYMEFSRWGIQQIILISRLHYIKNPWIQRGINIAASYVFGRGVEVSSPDDAANDCLKDFFERNKETLGQIALTDLQRRKYYDGNVFFVCFPDAMSNGTVEVRTIDSTEIEEIVTDPDDTDRPWLYKRNWVQRIFDQNTGAVQTKEQHAWYPSLKLWQQVNGMADDKPKDTAPDESVKVISGVPVMWASPVLHRKCGSVAKWHFGCPLVYAALDDVKAGRRFLNACVTVKLALAQVAFTLTTKGGQQAIQGAKQALSTTVGPSSALWDTNPTAVDASIFASGPGTTLQAFKSTGAGGDPAEVKEWRNMVACVLRIPPTYLADMETSNLATATTLDRPTELGFLEFQEEWREDLITLAKFAVSVSGKAMNGKVREALGKDGDGKVVVLEAARRLSADGKRMEYVVEAPAAKKSKEIQVLVTFPAIREGDLPQMINAIVEAMTLGNKGGQVTGIDEKQGVFLLLKQLGVEDAEELVEQMYPSSGENAYDPDRSEEDLPTPIPTAPPIAPGGAPQDPGGHPAAPQAPAAKAMEALARLAEALSRRKGKAA